MVKISNGRLRSSIHLGGSSTYYGSHNETGGVPFDLGDWVRRSNPESGSSFELNPSQGSGPDRAGGLCRTRFDFSKNRYTSLSRTFPS